MNFPISFLIEISASQALLVVGEESCGKSTLLRTLLRLAPETQEANRRKLCTFDRWPESKERC